MGKRLIQQARGKGGPTYRAPSFRYKGEAKHYRTSSNLLEGEIVDLIHCPGHSSPLAKISYAGDAVFMIASEGMKVGDIVFSGEHAENDTGNTLPLGNIPEGTAVYNIESVPGDGGKFVRSSGTFAKIVTKTSEGVIVQLPSKKRKEFNVKCRASIGMVAGGGRTDKPLLKAGTKFYKMRQKNKLWPKVSGASMNAVDHPFGGGRSSRKGRPTIAPRNAPPGRKVGMIRPRRTGRKK